MFKYRINTVFRVSCSGNRADLPASSTGRLDDYTVGLSLHEFCHGQLRMAAVCLQQPLYGRVQTDCRLQVEASFQQLTILHEPMS